MLLAHYDKETNKNQYLIDHLNNVAVQSSAATDFLCFEGIDKEDIRRVIKNMGLYHDIGKSMEAFQAYLKTNSGGDEKNHALISAVMYYLNCNKEQIIDYLAFLSIARHHGQISNCIEKNNRGFTILKSQYNDIINNIKKDKEVEKLINISINKFDENKLVDYLDMQFAKLMGKRNRNDMWFFLLQFMFSKLIYADKLDSSNLGFNNETYSITNNDIDTYIRKKTNGRVANLDDKRVNIRRSVLEEIENLTDEQIDTTRIFTLTAPTGTGKTLTSISAAIKLAERIENKYGYKPSIITALPFINIIEQTMIDYEEIFGDIMVSCSAIESELKKDIPLKDKYLLTNAWESPVILTTFVQFFESILTSQNTRLLKLNKMSASIVILDEIQSIPSKYMPLLGFVINKLSIHYGTRFILMTATQPEIVTSANYFLQGNEQMKAFELLKNSKHYYEQLRRTKIVPVMDSVTDNQKLVEFIMKTKRENEAALVVVNTISQSIELYKMLKDKYTTLYLSTNIVGVDRKAVIKKAKQMLDNKVPFIMVSTQTIEAGVDLDFDVGYRDLAPLESIIQTAGRINRSGKKHDYCTLYVFNTSSSKNVYKLYNISITQKALNKEYTEDKYMEMISDYYKELLSDKSYDREIREAITRLDYETIDKFALIEKQDVKQVIIEKDDTIHELLNQYCSLIRIKDKDYETKATLKRINNKISSYSLDLRIRKLLKNKPFAFKNIYGIDIDIYIVPAENIEQYYDETGFIVDSEGALMF